MAQQRKKISRHKPEMTKMLELTDRSFSVTAINMGKGLVKKMGNICEQIEIFRREIHMFFYLFMEMNYYINNLSRNYSYLVFIESHRIFQMIKETKVLCLNSTKRFYYGKLR